MLGLLISSADNSHRGCLRKQGLDHYEPLSALARISHKEQVHRGSEPAITLLAQGLKAGAEEPPDADTV
jgi:hypothetical protein